MAFSRRILLFVGAAVILIIAIVGIWTFYDAWSAGMLPWQPEPTRIAVTPFADLPTPSATP